MSEHENAPAAPPEGEQMPVSFHVPGLVSELRKAGMPTTETVPARPSLILGAALCLEQQVAALAAATARADAFQKALHTEREGHTKAEALWLEAAKVQRERADAAQAEAERLCGAVLPEGVDVVNRVMTRAIEARAIPATPAPETEPTYPCVECGKLRTKAEGGTTFTVCDACWDKDKTPAPGPSAEDALRTLTVADLLAWLMARPGCSWVATVSDVARYLEEQRPGAWHKHTCQFLLGRECNCGLAALARAPGGQDVR